MTPALGYKSTQESRVCQLLKGELGSPSTDERTRAKTPWGPAAAIHSRGLTHYVTDYGRSYSDAVARSPTNRIPACPRPRA